MVVSGSISLYTLLSWGRSRQAMPKTGASVPGCRHYIEDPRYEHKLLESKAGCLGVSSVGEGGPGRAAQAIGPEGAAINHCFKASGFGGRGSPATCQHGRLRLLAPLQ